MQRNYNDDTGAGPDWFFAMISFMFKATFFLKNLSFFAVISLFMFGIVRRTFGKQDMHLAQAIGAASDIFIECMRSPFQTGLGAIMYTIIIIHVFQHEFSFMIKQFAVKE